MINGLCLIVIVIINNINSLLFVLINNIISNISSGWPPGNSSRFLLNFLKKK